MSTIEQWQFGLLCLFALMGWILWLTSLSREWFLVGFANWLVRKLFTFALITSGVANGSSQFLAEYRRVRKTKVEPISELAEVNSRP